MTRLAFLHPALIGMGLHVASARVRRALVGHRRYRGTAEDILRAGLEDCWSGEYLTASPGHYRQLWTRDLGFAAPSLVRLGGPWPDRLLATLTWALEVWRDRRSHVTTTINPLLRWPVDIFDYGVDSLPLLLASLQALTRSEEDAIVERAHRVVNGHQAWIETEVRHFVDQVVDRSTGLVRSDRAFSAHRDTFRNGSTAYANAMVALLGRVVAETGWGPDLLSRSFVFPDPASEVMSTAPMTVAGIRRESAHIPATGMGESGTDPGPQNGKMRAIEGRIATERGVTEMAPPAGFASGDTAPPLRGGLDWGGLLVRHFWIGDRFRDRLVAEETSGEANVWPFHLGLIDDPGDAMLGTALETLRREGYTTPYPLKFEAQARTDGLLPAYRLWSPDYQTTTSWTSLGSIYLSLLRRVDPTTAHAELDRMRALIERDGTLWEVIGGDGRPWRSRSRLSISDVSMLWGAILLETFEADRAWHTTRR